MKALIAAAALLGAAPLAAQTATPAPNAGTAAPAKLDLASKQINNPAVPWNIYGPTQTTKLLPKDGPNGYPATRVTVSAKTPNAWDDGAGVPVPAAIAAGDTVLMAVYLRAPQAKDGETVELPFVGLVGATAPYTGLANGHATVTNQWKMYFAKGVAPSAFPANGAQATVHLGAAKGVIDIGPVRVFDLGAGFDPARLPG